MTTSTHDEVLVGAMAIRPRIEPDKIDAVIAIHEFDVAAGASLAIPDNRDAADETLNSGLGQMRCVWQQTSGGLRCTWV